MNDVTYGIKDVIHGIYHINMLIYLMIYWIMWIIKDNNIWRGVHVFDEEWWTGSMHIWFDHNFITTKATSAYETTGAEQGNCIDMLILYYTISWFQSNLLILLSGRNPIHPSQPITLCYDLVILLDFQNEVSTNHCTCCSCFRCYFSI